jgi:hypothetical protein
MDKRKRVELESAFLAFCNVASDMGFDFTYDSKLTCHHKNDSAHVVNLDPREFIPTDTPEINELN